MTETNVISMHLRSAVKRQGMKQVELSRKIHRSASTVNAYMQNQETPIEAIQDIVGVLNDSTLNQQLSHEYFGTVPAMDSLVYQDNPHVLEFLQKKEADERKAKKENALMALAKNDASLTIDDKNIIKDYSNEYLDELLVETKIVIALLAKADMSIMQAINNRKHYWANEGYLKG